MTNSPKSPPPGLVTVPAAHGAPHGYYARAGYRLAGERAIRIDMLERLADMIRGLDAREGFEATADMLSITGLTLDQFAKLMKGLGFEAAEGSRVKRRPEPPKPEAAAVEVATDPDAPATPTEIPADTPAETPPGPPPETPQEAPAEAPDSPPAEVPQESPAPDEAQAGPVPAKAAEEMEVFFTFRRAPRQRPEKGQRRPQNDGAKPREDGRPAFKGKPRHGSGPRGKGSAKPEGPKVTAARPPRAEQPVDPDNPFAALMALKTRR